MTRADLFLVEKGFAASRAEAQAAIKAGLVRINGEVLDKPSRGVPDGAAVQYEKPHPYVSRGGVKLAAALDHFHLSAEDRIALDVGASTGGFTEVLLASGAARVYAVDVGHDQLHPKLQRDSRVIRRDGVNARDMDAHIVPQPPGAIAIDVSFIGLRLVLPSVLALAAPGAWAVALVKPQFEVGVTALGKGGIVRDLEARKAALDEIVKFLNARPLWTVLGTMQSPVAGGDGNIEYLLAAQRE